MATTTSDPDPAPDPRGKVVGKYKIFWNQPPPNKHIIVLQFPNRTPSQPYNSINGLKPLEMRIKPKSNLVEIDIPLYFGSEFDKKRGIEYGKALKNNRTLKAGGSLGFAGGFGIAGGSYARRRDEPEEQDVDMEGTTFEEEVAKGNVMDRFTLGGQAIIFNNTQPMYAIGVFHGDELHLTRADAFCMLQPRFHHLDAIAENEKANSRMQREAEHGGPEPEARAINMAVKSTGEDELDKSDIAKWLREVQEEKWERLEWIDEGDYASYQTYQEGFFLNKEAQGNTLISAMTPLQYLDAISCPRVDPSNMGKKIMSTNDWSDDIPSTDDEDEAVTEEPSTQASNK